MTTRLMSALRAAPVTVPALAALALFLVWSTDQAGYPVTHWAPGALIVLVLVILALGAVRVRVAEIPVPIRVALAAFAAYTALSYLSIAWADVPGDAWEGANRTLLYLLVFALFACWSQRGQTAVLLLGAWTIAMIALAAFSLLHVSAAGGAELQSLIPGGRLVYPSGYPNANAAQWLMAFWPAVLLARGEQLPSAVRGLLAGGAVLLAEVALLSQSRGSLYATPVMLLLVFLVVPDRLRTFALLAPVALAVGLAAPVVLRVGDHLSPSGDVTASTVHAATLATFLAALAAGLVVGLGSVAERRATLSEPSRRRIRTGLVAVAIATLVAVLAGGLVAAGDPVKRVDHAWKSFKGGYGTSTGSRLVSGLGSNRYDFYRVALDEFSAHPVLGIGADNFQQQYLARGRSNETPHYPHSVELRALSQTGSIGALLLLAGFGAAVLAGIRAMRAADPLGRVVAAAALSGFAYWIVHGSVDWFWEFAGLGAPAFALLGLSGALARRGGSAGASGEAALAGASDASGASGERVLAGASGAPAASGGVLRLRVALLGLAAVGALALAGSIAAPWLSQLELTSAARIWTTAPQTAYARLDDAARLNPLSDEAYLLAGSIALRYRDLPRADREFALALGRTPGDAYATLQRGAIASARGDRAAALRLLERAVRLNPRDELARQALLVVREGKRVDIEELERSILAKARRLA